ncbi:MAG: hypothetical protein AB1700_21610, partial [Bacillota bacterium]
CVIPPVALTSYTAAGIAGANPTKVALTGLKLAMAGLIIPYFFVYQPMLLIHQVQATRLIWAAVSGTLGIWCLATAAQAYLSKPINGQERLCFFVAAVGLIDPGLLTDAIGFTAMGVGLLSFAIRTRREVRPAAPSASR